MGKLLPILILAVMITVACLVSPRRSENTPRNSTAAREPTSVTPKSGGAVEGGQQSAAHTAEQSVPLDFDVKLPRRPLAAIIFEGNSTGSSQSLLKLLKTHPGQIPESEQIQSDVQTLFATHIFSNIEARVDQSPQGPVLVFRVSEPLLIDKRLNGYEE